MRPLKSVEQAAELLGISPWTVRAYVRQRKLRSVRIGRRVLLQEDDLQQFVSAATEQQISEVPVGGSRDSQAPTSPQEHENA